MPVVGVAWRRQEKGSSDHTKADLVQLFPGARNSGSPHKTAKDLRCTGSEIARQGLV